MRRVGKTMVHIAIWLCTLTLFACYTILGLKYLTANRWQAYLVAVLILISAAFIAMFLVDIWHELGHILIGLCCNFKVIKASLSFLNFDATTTKLRFYLSNPFGKLGGESVLVPKSERHIKGKFILTACGGVIFNVVLLILAVLAFIFYRQLSFWQYVLCTAFVPYAFYQFVLNSIPLQIGGLPTDGKMIADCIKNGDEGLLLQQLLAIESYLLQGKSPREIPQRLYTTNIVLPEDNSYFILYQLQKLYYFLDREEVDNTLQVALHLMQLECYFTQEYRERILAEILFVLTLYTEEEVADFLERELQNYLQQNDMLAVRTRLAILAKKQGFDSICTEWDKAYKQAQSYTIAGVAKFECTALQYIKTEFDIENKE